MYKRNFRTAALVGLLSIATVMLSGIPGSVLKADASAGYYFSAPPRVACTPVPGVTVPAGTHVADRGQIIYMIQTGQIAFQFFQAGQAHPTVRFLNVYNASACHIDAVNFWQVYKVFYPDGHPLRYAGQELIHQEGPYPIPAGYGLQFAFEGPGCALQLDYGIGAPSAHVSGVIENHLPLCPLPKAVLTVQKTGPATMTPGGQGNYHVVITNTGNGPANNVRVYDRLPHANGLTFLGSSVPGCVMTQPSSRPDLDQVECPSLGTIPAGQSYHLDFSYRFPTNPVCGGVYVDSVFVGADNAPAVTSEVGTTMQCAQCSDGADNDGDGAADGSDFSCAGPNDNDETNPKAQCQDGADNDGDGRVDFPNDPGCSSPQDNDESNPYQCSDGQDNDGDGAADGTDFSCAGPFDDDETNPKAQCQDGADNDGDGFVDFPQDPGCTSKQDNDESNSFQCSDGLDNDNDGASDMNDFSCSGPTDNDETNPKAQCQDGQDNDGDGKTDFPNDPGCSSRQDNDESNPAQCQDGQDNDGDGATDFPNDYSCSGPTDDDETNPKAQCQDGQDNDGDGKTDFPQDPGCTSKQDNDEFNAMSSSSTSIYDSSNSSSSSSSSSSPISSSSSSVTSSSSSSSSAAPQCSDHVDNDGDNKIDYLDPGCYTNGQYNPNDNDETDVASSSSSSSSSSMTSSSSSSSARATLSVQKTVTGQPTPGAQLQYSVTVTNTSNVVATQVTFDDFVPFNTDIVTYTGECSTVTVNGVQAVRCLVGTLNPGQSRTLPIILAVKPTAACSNGASVTNVVAAWGANADTVTLPAPHVTQIVCGSSSSSSVISSSSSSALPQCNDGLDNDADGAIDNLDFSCNGPNDNDETNPKAACQDGFDNDFDSLIDIADPGCHTDGNANNPNSYNRQDNDEFNAVSSSSSSSSSIISSSSSSSSVVNQCNDGQDNDGDGATDANDFSCNGPNDNDETNPKAACQDGYDNDFDGLIDINDPGCHSDGNANNPNSYNRQDNDEYNVFSSSSSSYSTGNCADARDNDGDGYIDANDPDCHADGNVNNPDSYRPTFFENSFNRSSSSSYGNNNGNRLRVTKNASAREAFPGGTIEFTIIVRNTGSEPIYNVVVEDSFDDSEFTVRDEGDADETGDGLEWRIGTLGSGDTETLRYRLALRNSLRAGRTVENDVEARGENGQNGSDSVSIAVLGNLPQTGSFWNTSSSPYLTPVEHDDVGFFGGILNWFKGLLSW